MYHLLGLEVLFGEEVGDVPCADFLLEGGELGVKVTAFEVEDTVAEMVVLDVGHLTLYPLAELAEVGDGTRDDKVEIALHLLGMDCSARTFCSCNCWATSCTTLIFLPIESTR